MATTSNIETQIIREDERLEAQKLRLLEDARNLYSQPLLLPAIRAVGLSKGQQEAASLARLGIGSFEPFIQAGSEGITQGQKLAQLGALGAAGINYAPEFNAAQNASLAGITAARGVGQAANIAGNFLQADLAPSQNILGQASGLTNEMVAQGAPAQQRALGAIGQGQDAFGRMTGGALAQDVGQGFVGQGAQRANEMVGAGLRGVNQGQQALGQGILAGGQISGAGLGAQQQGIGTVQQGIAGLEQATRAYDPTQVSAFMNPYQEQVTAKALEQMRRQGDIANQQLAAQAIRTGAFGGTREGVQRAEQERNLQDLMSQRIFQDSAANFSQAQTAAMTAAEQQQQRQLAASQGLSNAGTAIGGLGINAANILGQEAQTLGSLGAQQGALGTQAANILGQSGQQLTQAGQATGALGAQQANIYGQMGQGLTQAGQAQSAVGSNLANIYGQAGQQLGNIGTTLGQQGLSQAQLGQAGGSTMGALAGQQAQLYGTLGQGIGGLAAQQANIDLNRASTLGNLGSNMAQMGVQQGAMGQALQQGRAADVSLLSGIGGLEQATAQQQEDALRATQLQKTMAPFQQLAFVSDIYKGAPSSQMTLTSSSAPSATPLQSLIGTVGGAAATGAALNKAGLF